MAWKKTNDIHYQHIADSIRYAKDGTEYISSLAQAREEIQEDNEIFENISEAIQNKTGAEERYEKDELVDAINEELVYPILDQLTATPDTVQKTYTPQAPAIGFDNVTVEAYDDYVAKRIKRNPYTYVLTDKNSSNLQEHTFAFDGGLIEIYFNCSVSVSPRYMFQDCKNLNNVIFNNPQDNLSHDMFQNCYNLIQLDCPASVSTLNKFVFENCSKFKILVLRNNNVVSLINVDAFIKTPFRNGTGGTVYVPQALISSYQSATNWSALESITFSPIEGSPYEQGGAS